MRRLLIAVAALTVAVVAKPKQARADGCPGAFWSPSTGTCGFTGRTCGGTGCEYDCEDGRHCYDFGDI